VIEQLCGCLVAAEVNPQQQLFIITTWTIKANQLEHLTKRILGNRHKIS